MSPATWDLAARAAVLTALVLALGNYACWSGAILAVPLSFALGAVLGWLSRGGECHTSRESKERRP